MAFTRRVLLGSAIGTICSRAQSPATAILECTSEFTSVDLQTGEGLHCLNFRMSPANFPIRKATLILHFPETVPRKVHLTSLSAVPKPGTWKRGATVTAAVRDAREGWGSIDVPSTVIREITKSGSLGIAIVLPARRQLEPPSLVISGRLSPWPPFLTVEGAAPSAKTSRK